MKEEILSIWDLILPPIYILIIFIIGHLVQIKYVKTNEVYKYLKIGLLAKIAGAIAMSLIYTLYYTGGDTTEYFKGSVSMVKLFFKNHETFFSIMADNLTKENRSEFDSETGWPFYYKEHASFTVTRLTTIIQFLSFQSYLVTSIILGAVSYLGTWRLYILFCEIYPSLYKQFRISILLVPSVLFWGSGVLKDTYTLMAASWFTYSFYRVFVVPKKVTINVIMMIFMAYLLIKIKPYIFIALMPGALLWLSVERVKRINNWLLKILAGPLLIVFLSVMGYFLLNTLSSGFGQYSSTQGILQKAQNTQVDLKQGYYGGNSFDIGDFDASITGALEKLPAAIVAGLFRPFLWESKNFVMVIAALENSVLMFLSIFLLFKLGIYRFYKVIAHEPILFFSIIFSLFFAFSIGLTTSNFGAMVRYKIPAIPFYLSSLIIINDFYIKKRDEENAALAEIKLKSGIKA
ncbi:MAG: hypothetical protein IPP32_15670 [Bacteroidetes bacterium]|nr:hypothetical protein [Bacteroidota bacterium]